MKTKEFRTGRGEGGEIGPDGALKTKKDCKLVGQSWEKKRGTTFLKTIKKKTRHRKDNRM